MTYKELYSEGESALETAGVPDAGLDARLLLEQVCGTCRNDLLAHGDRMVEAGQQEAYRELIAKRSERIPLQHLTGTQNFIGLDFMVNADVLIPRQDTEILAEEVLKNLHDGMRVLDMCTGSGCILISLLYYTNNCEGVGADISEEALTVARRNAGRLLGRKAAGMCSGIGGYRDSGESGLAASTEFTDRTEGLQDMKESLQGRTEGLQGMTEGLQGMKDSLQDMKDGLGGISFVRSDLFEQVAGRFDIIVSNPPYIRSDVIPGLMPEVREHEPWQALDGGADGLLFYRRILEESRGHLFGGGMLFFEIGYDQGEEVSRLMEQAGFLEINVVKDYGGLDRVVYGTLRHGM